MTLKRRWPNEAENARENSIALAMRIDNLARPILDGEQMTQIEVVRRAGQICRAALEILRELQAVGPQRLLE